MKKVKFFLFLFKMQLILLIAGCSKGELPTAPAVVTSTVTQAPAKPAGPSLEEIEMARRAKEMAALKVIPMEEILKDETNAYFMQKQVNGITFKFSATPLLSRVDADLKRGTKLISMLRTAGYVPVAKEDPADFVLIFRPAYDNPNEGIITKVSKYGSKDVTRYPMDSLLAAIKNSTIETVL